MGMSYSNVLNVVIMCQRSTRKAIDIQENLVDKSTLNRPRSKQTNNDNMNELGSAKASVKRELGDWLQSKSVAAELCCQSKTRNFRFSASWWIGDMWNRRMNCFSEWKVRVNQITVGYIPVTNHGMSRCEKQSFGNIFHVREINCIFEKQPSKSINWPLKRGGRCGKVSIRESAWNESKDCILGGTGKRCR